MSDRSPEEKALFWGQGARPSPSPELDRAVLLLAHRAKMRRQFHRTLCFKMLPAAAALAIGFSVLFADRSAVPQAVQVSSRNAGDLSELWDWNNLENESADLTENLEYAGVELASL